MHLVLLHKKKKQENTTVKSRDLNHEIIVSNVIHKRGLWAHPAAIYASAIVRESSAIISRHNVFCSCQAYYNSENSSPNRYCRNPTPAVV